MSARPDVRRFDDATPPFASRPAVRGQAFDDGVVASVWVAPAVFGTADPAGLIVVLAAGGWTLGLDRSGRPVLRLTPDLAGAEHSPERSPLELRGGRALPRLVWTHLAVTVDAASGTLGLVVDGVPVGGRPGGVLVHPGGLATSSGEPGTSPGELVTSGEPGASSGDALWVGGPSAASAPDPFGYGTFRGLLCLDAPDGSVAHRPTDDPPGVDPAAAWATDQGRFDADRDRPRFHFLPPAGWMNEPHGILHRDGRHHLFYQRNELGAFWGNITWGHAVSTDLIHWTDLGSNLTPARIPYAPDGVWSGSSIVDADGIPYLFFTAGDNRDHPNQRTAWARPADLADPDLREWSPGPAPVTTLTDALPALRRAGLEPLPSEFRDPFVWRDGDTWFQLVGAGIAGRGGTALLYRSADAASAGWDFVGPLAIGDATARPDTGVHWELPVLLPVGRDEAGRPKHALFVTPWWPEPTEHSLLHQWYWVGTWDPASASWTPDHTEPRALDYGGYFTGVTGSLDEAGRTLLWTITQDLLPHGEHRRRGWAGSAGLPVSVRYSDGDLRIEPVAEVSSLRGEPVVEVAASDRAAVPFSAGPTYEVALEIDLPIGGRAVVDVRLGEAAPSVSLALERVRTDEGRLSVARPATDQPLRDRRGGPFRMRSDEPVRLRVFVDHSVVEAYVQEHRALTTRAFASDGVTEDGRVAVSDGARILGLIVWPLAAAIVQERLAGD